MPEKLLEQNTLIGTWKMVSWEMKKPDGKAYYPFNQNPVGYLLHTQEGYVSLNMMRADRPPLGIANKELMQARELLVKPELLKFTWRRYIKDFFRYLEASVNYVSYSGRYEVQSNQKLIHYVEVSIIPEWIGIDIEHTFELVGERCLLLRSTLGDDDHLLTWERV